MRKYSQKKYTWESTVRKKLRWESTYSQRNHHCGPILIVYTRLSANLLITNLKFVNGQVLVWFGLAWQFLYIFYFAWSFSIFRCWFGLAWQPVSCREDSLPPPPPLPPPSPPPLPPSPPHIRHPKAKLCPTLQVEKGFKTLRLTWKVILLYWT